MIVFSAYYWVVFILAFVLPAWLFSRILPKAGFPAWWALAALIPLVNVIAFWLFAFSDWSNRPKR